LADCAFGLMIDTKQQQGMAKKIRFPESSGFGIKPVSRDGTDRLVRSAIEVCSAS
jgi:isocitrate dehydrogenase